MMTLIQMKCLSFNEGTMLVFFYKDKEIIAVRAYLLNDFLERIHLKIEKEIKYNLDCIDEKWKDNQCILYH